MPSRSQATTTQTTTATGRGTCLAKSSSGSTGSKMNPTIINLKSNYDDDDLYIIGAVCVSVSKSHYLCIQRICFQTLLNSRDLFVSHVYRQLDNKNPKMYIKIPRCS